MNLLSPTLQKTLLDGVDVHPSGGHHIPLNAFWSLIAARNKESRDRCFMYRSAIRPCI